MSKTTGDVKGIITSKTGTPAMSVTLEDVVHVPQAQFNTLSVTTLMIEGWALSGDKNKMSVKVSAVTPFDIIMKTPKGDSFCVNVQSFRDVGCAVVKLSKSKARKLLEYSNHDSAINTAKSLGWKLAGSKQICESCHLAKSK